MSTKAMDTIQTNYSDTKEKLLDELRYVIADAEELLHVTANQAGDEATVVRARIQKSMQAVKERVGAMETVVLERGKQAAKATDMYVHENPWKSIGIFAGAGVIIGMLIARR